MNERLFSMLFGIGIVTPFVLMGYFIAEYLWKEQGECLGGCVYPMVNGLAIFIGFFVATLSFVGFVCLFDWILDRVENTISKPNMYYKQQNTQTHKPNPTEVE